MTRAYTVSQINSYIKRMFAQDFLLPMVQIKGEVSNCKYHSSGHIYFTLKDSGAAIACVMFASARTRLKFRLEDGQQVVAGGSVSVYERDGRYQLYAESITMDGLGELYQRYLQLKEELADMGMFDAAYKKPIPAYVRRLGVVTAPTGAAVRDIIQISKRRNPGIEIVLYPAKVQGEGAAESVAEGIMTLEKAGVDLIIIGRGGGSIEDLWAFNEELTARAVFACEVPIISAVGHETDTVITDFVADLRAPTPSAAAELAVADIRKLMEQLQAERQRLTERMEARIDLARGELQRRALALRAADPIHRARQSRQRLGEIQQRLAGSMQLRLERTTNRNQTLRERLDHGITLRLEKARRDCLVRKAALKGLSPYDKLSQGYALATAPDGSRLASVAQVSAGDEIQVYLRDGQLKARVTSAESSGSGA
ncbi:MAG: exodeoxyribonuclease VII large subunit [Lachnospiraceae bacterium]|nr:exodeoxyribonuclease VII large subunit [Lachnospiraceae bacterium]